MVFAALVFAACVAQAENVVGNVGEVKLKGFLGSRLDAMIARHVEATDIEYLTSCFQEKTERKGWWQTEFWGKFMHSAVPYGVYSGSQKVREAVDRSVDRVLASQEPCGYIGNYPDELRCNSGWDVWGMKYTMLGLIHYYDGTRSGSQSEVERGDRALEACKRLCDYVIGEIGPDGRRGRAVWQTGYWSGMASSSILEPVVWLYNRTKERKYLDFATFIVKGLREPESGPRLVDLALKGISVADRNGHGNTQKPEGGYWCQDNRWKAYEMMSCYQGLLDYVQVKSEALGVKSYEDDPLFLAAVKAAEDIAKEEINLAGGCSCSEAWFHGARKQHLPHCRLQETCVTTTWMRLCERLLELTGDARWADRIERTFYNAYLAALKSDGSEFPAYTPLSGNRWRGMDHCFMHTDCCMMNGPRGFLVFLRKLCERKDETTTFNFYASALVPGFDMYTLYPRDGFVRIVSHTSGRRVVRLRVPGWCGSMSVKVNGKEFKGAVTDGYLSIGREWALGDVVELSVDLPVVAHKLDHSVAFTRGPVLLARDSRFNDGDMTETFREGIADGQRMDCFSAVRTPIPEMWMAFSATLPIGAHTENPEAGNPTTVFFCDYASAGNEWRRDNFYRTWFPEELGPVESVAPDDIDRLCPPRPETAAKFQGESCPAAARDYRASAKMAYRYMTSLPAMTVLVETGKPNQKYQHNAYVSKTHAAHIEAMLDWAKFEPVNRETAMRFAKASAEFLLKELEPASAPLAFWPPTYGRKPLEFDPKTDGPYKKPSMVGNEPEGAVKYRGEVMLLYPATVGAAFVDYWRATKDERFLTAAKGIAETYLKTRRADGSWPLKMKLATGETMGENTLVPTRPLELFEGLFDATQDPKWRAAADACFAWLEAHPLADWNWDGQFEDIKPEKPYKNPTKHNAVETMLHMLKRFPGDKARLATCRKILEFCEKRFVVWKTPSNHPNWPAPSVLEQYSCFTPIDASAAKMIRGYLAIYRAEGRSEDLAKARALANTITRVQKPSGRIPTFWEGVDTGDSGLSNERYDWLNCMAAAAKALMELSEESDSDAITFVDVTKPPYCADNTGKTDCTKVLVKVLDDILVREVEAYEATIEKLKRLSGNGKTDVYIGLEGSRVEGGRMKVVYPEKEPPTRIVYFPRGTYLVSDTITYSLKNLKARYYVVPYFDNCRNINFLGESRDETVIRLVDNAPGFSSGEMKPLVSFVNNEKKLPRDKEVSNVAFMNFMRNLTLDCGKGNPDAVGVKFLASNIGRLENLTVRTDRGRCGVYTMCSTQGVFENLTISGFDYGLDVYSSAMIVIDGLDVTGARKAGLFTGRSTINAVGIKAGEHPAAEFAEGQGRYYFRDQGLKLPEDRRGNHVYFEEERHAFRDMRFPPRPETGPDFAFVDDYGARGDGVTDSAPAVQKAMDSGKSAVVFGAGEYLLNGKVRVPKGVRKIDFRFCSLAAGIRLVGGEYDAAFEIAEDAAEPLTVESLDAWENFRGHMRLFKHAVKRDAVFRDIHLMSASLYFNTVPGSRVWFDNIFLTTGTYSQPGGVDIPGKGFVQVYNRIVPFEFHGQQVYGRQVNLERADVHVLNDASDILFDCFRTEGPGTALSSVNGGRTRVNLFNAGIGCKTAPQALFELRDSELELTGALAFGFNRNSEYDVIVNSVRGDKAERLAWDDVKTARGEHGRLIDFYASEGVENVKRRGK